MDLLQVKPERFEDIVPNRCDRVPLFFAVARLKNFLGKQTDIDHTNNPTLFVNNRKREELVEHKKFACVEDGSLRRNGYEPADHDLSERSIERRGEQPPSGQHSDESLFRIDRVEVNNALADTFAADALERVRHAHVSVQEWKIFPRVLNDRRIEIGNADLLSHSSFLLDERCLCRAKSWQLQ